MLTKDDHVDRMAGSAVRSLSSRVIRDTTNVGHRGHYVLVKDAFVRTSPPGIAEGGRRGKASRRTDPRWMEGPRMRLPNTEHTSRPWRIHEIAGDFKLEDVWALPTPGGPDDLGRLVRQITSEGESDSRVVRTLFALRWKLGALLGWDKPDSHVGTRVQTLRDRLPADLRDAPSGPDMREGPVVFTSVYQTHNEWAAEFANLMTHGVLHIGWVPDQAGGYRGQMAVLVKTNGLFGRLYMAAIAPFRHLVVYPILIRSIGREWQT
jgi:hypothetical protein